MADRKKQLSILAVVAVVLLIIYIAIGIALDRKATKDAEDETSKMMVTDIDASDIVSFSYTDGDDSFCFSCSSGDEVWYWEQDEGFPLDQDTIAAAISYYANITSTRMVKTADPDEDYGFDSPQYVITLEKESGDTITVKIGGMTGDEYYITADGGDTIYTVDSSIVDYMYSDIEDFKEEEQEEE